MLVKLIEPSISPQNQLYTPIGNSQCIRVGINSTHTNHLQNTVQRNWTLTLYGTVIQTGTVEVVLNTFDSYVDLNGLLQNRLYIFTIHNRLPEFDKSATISTLTTTPVVIDEFHPFYEPIEILGQLTTIGSNPSSAGPNNPVYTRLPVNWSIESRKSTALIIAASGLYVFAPSKIITHDRGYPETIQYSPFPTVPNMSIRVHLLPTITKLVSSEYSVNPRTRMEVTVFYLDQEGGERRFDTQDLVDKVVVDENRMHVVLFVPVFS